jgi:hypothetical protein
MENTGAALLVMLVCYFIKKIQQKERIAMFEITGGVGFAAGLILLIAAPGNYVRAEVIKNLAPQTDVSLIITFIKRFLKITVNFGDKYGFIIMAAAAILVFDLLFHQKRKLNLFVYIYAIAAMTGVYSMVLSPTFPDRAYLIAFVFCGITLGGIFINFNAPELIKRNNIVILLFILAVLFPSFLQAARNTVSIYLRWKDRIEYITAEKQKGNFDIAVKAPIPSRDKHTAQHGLVDVSDDKDKWQNTDIAKYFGLSSIKRLDDDTEWEPESQKFFKRSRY